MCFVTQYLCSYCSNPLDSTGALCKLAIRAGSKEFEWERAKVCVAYKVSINKKKKQCTDCKAWDKENAWNIFGVKILKMC